MKNEYKVHVKNKKRLSFYFFLLMFIRLLPAEQQARQLKFFNFFLHCFAFALLKGR